MWVCAFTTDDYIKHCDIIITAESPSMKKNIMKLIKSTNYLPLFLYSHISFMLSQYERSSHGLISFKHWYTVFDYGMFSNNSKIFELDTFYHGVDLISSFQEGFSNTLPLESTQQFQQHNCKLIPAIFRHMKLANGKLKGLFERQALQKLIWSD